MAPMPRRISSPQFIGRRAELDRLKAALDQAINDAPSAVLIAGEAGIGKTRLVDEFIATAAERGARVLVGACIEFAGEDLPYAPVTGALRSLAEELGPDGVRELAGTTWPAVACLVPSLGSGDDIRDAMSQGRLFELLLGLLVRTASDRPLVLVVEDLHWADQSTRDFLGFLLRQLRSERLLIVATYRSDELHRRHPLRPLLSETLRLAIVERVELTRFTRDELVAQIAAIRGEVGPPAELDRLFERSEGNPFFAEELVAASDGADEGLPETLRDVLLLRLEALGSSARRVLEVAAVAGRPVSEQLVVAGGLDDDAVHEGLRELTSAQLLIARDNGYAFRHALLREAVYEDLLPGDRHALHLALGDALERRPELTASTEGAAGEAAYHWFAAHDNSRALPALIRAGTVAMGVAAFVEAARAFELALELWDQTSDPGALAGCDHVELLRMAAHAADMAGTGRALPFARQALSELDSNDIVRRGVLLSALGGYAWDAGDVDDARSAHVEAIAVLPVEPPSAERARAVAAFAGFLMIIGEDEEARHRAEEAIALARSVGLRQVEGHALNTLGATLGDSGDIDAGIRSLESALAIAREVAAGDDVMRAYTNLSHVLGEAGRHDECLAVVTEALEVGKTLGLERTRNAMIAANGAHVHLRRGDYRACEGLLDYVLGLDPPPDSAAYAYGLRGVLRIVGGDLAAAEADLDRARAVWGREADVWLNCAPIASGRIEIALARKDYETAHAVARDAFDHVPDASCRAQKFETLAWAVRAEADRAGHGRDVRDRSVEEDAVASATAIFERLDELLHASPHPEPHHAHVAHAAAEVSRARGDPDVMLWREAVAALEPFQRRSAAYARWRLAEALLQTASALEEPAAVLREAADAAHVLGDVGLLHETRALARRARITLDVEEPVDEPPAPDEVSKLGLTPRETEVLRLIADGLTNREIGARLFITEKTASVHVSRILSKVGARSRVEAAGVAHRLGLVSESADAPV